MNCCLDCFNDRYLKHIIRERDNINTCDYCGNETYVISINDISDLFAIFEPYYETLEHGENFIYGEQDPTEVGETLYYLVQTEWQLFSETTLSEVLFDDIMKNLNPVYDNTKLYVRAVEAFSYESTVEVWEKFCKEIKESNRFFPSHSYVLENFKTILRENEQDIFANSIIYRGRIGKHSIEKMGPPPSNLARAGRANPKGISYVYTSPQKETCIAELRPYNSAIITIVEMTTTKPLKFVALNTNRPFLSPFQFNGSLLSGIESYLLYSKLVSDLSKPVGPENSDIDYLPTQYLSEFIKKEGYDGFTFKSSLGPGDNYVIFDKHSVNLNSIEYFEVDSIQYNTHQIIL